MLDCNGSFRSSRRTAHFATALLLMGIFALILYCSTYDSQDLRQERGKSAGDRVFQDDDASSHGVNKLHLLLPATQGGPDLCKTLLTAKMLRYPTPVLIAWNESYSSPTQMTGGSHLAKIFGVLQYLESLPMSAQSDLVLMLDAYDIWFQLRPDVLVKRFYSLNKAADERQAQRGASSPSFPQKIIFGAGKRCAPNQLHTIACYPIPMSPLPTDLYGNNTDTVIGRNKYTSNRQRYLNSGYALGRVSDLKVLFEAAAQEVSQTPDHLSEDNGSGGSDYMYHGSDQSIFNTLLGRQEYMRELWRRKAGIKPEPTIMEGIIMDDILSPPFTHEHLPDVEQSDEMKWEFGVGLDYWSQLGHQTVNSEMDAKWMSFNTEPLDTAFEGRNKFDCEARVTRTETLGDIEYQSPRPFDVVNLADDKSWAEIPLYTNLCTGSIPVMIHHNGDKAARANKWNNMWFQASSRDMLERSERRSKKALDQINIAWTDKGDRFHWEELCGSFNDMLG